MSRRRQKQSRYSPIVVVNNALHPEVLRLHALLARAAKINHPTVSSPSRSRNNIIAHVFYYTSNNNHNNNRSPITTLHNSPQRPRQLALEQTRPPSQRILFQTDVGFSSPVGRADRPGFEAVVDGDGVDEVAAAEDQSQLNCR